MKSFLEVFNENWDLISIAILASICFEVMQYGRTVLEKIIFVMYVAVILNSVYSSFAWAGKEKNNFLIIIILVFFWILIAYLLTIIIPILVSITGRF